ncbi:MAG: SPOR domain-containing protein, partial [Pelagibacterales bacterium]|nr:SPOR domain-containing protein [Pelagibacterales bacterium]
MEDFGYLKEEEQSKFTRILKKMFMLGATLLSIACFIYVTVNAYYYVYDEDNGEIETITSLEEPIKIMAEESSDNQETTIVNNSIYEDIFGNHKESKNKVATKIQLAPQPAFPPKQDKLTQVTEINNNTSIQEEKTPNQRRDQKIIVYSDKEKEQNQKDLLTKTNGNSLTEKEKVKDLNSNKRKSIKVQIAALTSESAAQDYWKKVSNSNSRLFSGLSSFIQKVDLGKRGIFYRLQIGNFPDQTEAE